MKEKTFKKWFEEKSDLAKWKAYEAVEWCKRNKEAILVIGPMAAGVVVQVMKTATKCHLANEEKALKDRYVYDRFNGHYYELKRKPTNSEWIQIDIRKANGESLGWILNDMRLLK